MARREKVLHTLRRSGKRRKENLFVCLFVEKNVTLWDIPAKSTSELFILTRILDVVEVHTLNI